jgi:hypothetical protein
VLSDQLHREESTSLRRPAGPGLSFKSMVAGGTDAADCQLPDSSAPYEAYGRPSAQPVYTLHCCLGKDGFRSFQYVHLDSWSHFEASSEGHTIRLRFGGTRLIDLTVVGRNLRLLYDYIHQHRAPSIRLCDRDFEDGAKPVITRISIDPVQAVEGDQLLLP